MPYIRYEYNPNDPNSKDEARRKAYYQCFISVISLCGSIGSLIYFTCSVASLFKRNYAMDLLYSMGFIVLMATLDFFILFSQLDRESKKEIASKYFLFFFGGILDLSCIIGIVVSIGSLCHYGYGVILLLCTSAALIIISITIYLIYRKIKGYKPLRFRLFTEKNISNNWIASNQINEDTHTVLTDKKCQETLETIFCHKCGKKLPGDSIFCSICGAKLR